MMLGHWPVKTERRLRARVVSLGPAFDRHQCSSKKAVPFPAAEGMSESDSKSTVAAGGLKFAEKSPISIVSASLEWPIACPFSREPNPFVPRHCW